MKSIIITLLWIGIIWSILIQWRGVKQDYEVYKKDNTLSTYIPPYYIIWMVLLLLILLASYG